MKKIYILLFLIIIQDFFAQNNTTPPLERIISISADNQTIENILDEIAQKGGFVFSYSSKAINGKSQTSIHAENKPVRFVLSEIFGNSVNFKTRGKYIILRKSGLKNDKSTTTIEGYVYDSQTGDKITGASIYDKNLMASAITDQYGYFSMVVPSNKPITSIRVSKNGCFDTTLITQEIDNKIRSLELASCAQDTLPKYIKPFMNLPKITPKWLIPKKIELNSLNISDTILRAVQLSFIPGVSTNKLLGGNAYNDVSINILGGYVQGVRYVEFGGILNIVREDASYLQYGGVGNIVGRNFKGIQYAGVFNYAYSVRGGQVAGVVNISQTVSKVQVAGIVNHAPENIVQVAGIFNNSSQSDYQVSGVLNRSTYSKIQVAGVLNLSYKTRDIQIAGIINNSNETRIQIAAILNRARYIKGFQVGLINIADSCVGVPFGLLSFVKNGYHKLEVSTDELFAANISYRTGVKIFHTFLTTGVSAYNKSNPTIQLGYGIGTTWGSNIKYTYDLDFSAHPVFERRTFNYENMLYKLYFGIDRKINGKLSLAAGISCNMLVNDRKNNSYKESYSNVQPYWLTNTNLIGDINIKTWIGGKVALRLF
jgi:hypothetical protein